MPDLSKRKAAAERAKRRRKNLKDVPLRKCEDCGAEIPRKDAAHDPVRCRPCLEARNVTLADGNPVRRSREGGDAA